MAILTARHAVDMMQPALGDTARERLAVAYLDRRGGLLDLELRDAVPDHVPLPIRAILARALAVDSAGMVIAHNHPSGDAGPSVADVAATRRLALTCAAVDIRLHDHLIFAGEECFSFRLEGLL